MDQPPVFWSTAAEVADWISQRLHPFDAHDVGSILPSGFPAYARILHPASRLEENHEIKVRWAEVASRSGRVVHPQMQFEKINPDRVEFHEPEDGTLPYDELMSLIEILRGFTATPDRCWFCMWDGYGWLNEGGMVMLSTDSTEGTRLPLAVPKNILSGPRVHLPQRDYLLYNGHIGAATAFCDYPWGQTPNLWWPDDQAWCVASEIDLPCTYIGGDAQLIESLLGDRRIEALPAQLTDDITIDSDVVNG